MFDLKPNSYSRLHISPNIPKPAKRGQIVRSSVVAAFNVAGIEQVVAGNKQRCVERAYLKREADMHIGDKRRRNTVRLASIGGIGAPGGVEVSVHAVVIATFGTQVDPSEKPDVRNDSYLRLRRIADE
jgi:hypothetical protein